MEMKTTMAHSNAEQYNRGSDGELSGHDGVQRYGCHHGPQLHLKQGVTGLKELWDPFQLYKIGFRSNMGNHRVCSNRSRVWN